MGRIEKISNVEVVGYTLAPQLKRTIEEWHVSSDGKYLIGMDKDGRTTLEIPKHLCIIEYFYGKEIV